MTTTREAVEAHARACRTAIKAGKVRPAYSGPRLAGANLGSANLSGADLYGATITNTAALLDALGVKVDP